MAWSGKGEQHTSHEVEFIAPAIPIWVGLPARQPERKCWWTLQRPLTASKFAAGEGGRKCGELNSFMFMLIYVIENSVGAYPAQLDNGLCVLDNVAAWLLHRTIYKPYCYVGGCSPLSYNHCWVIDLSSIKIGPLQQHPVLDEASSIRRPGLVMWRSHFMLVRSQLSWRYI